MNERNIGLRKAIDITAEKISEAVFINNSIRTGEKKKSFKLFRNK